MLLRGDGWGAAAALRCTHNWRCCASFASAFSRSAAAALPPHACSNRQDVFLFFFLSFPACRAAAAVSRHRRRSTTAPIAFGKSQNAKSAQVHWSLSAAPEPLGLFLEFRRTLQLHAKGLWNYNSNKCRNPQKPSSNAPAAAAAADQEQQQQRSSRKGSSLCPAAAGAPQPRAYNYLILT